MTSETTLNPEVLRGMKKFLASYNEDAYRIVEQATKNKAARENLSVFIGPATIAMVDEEKKTTKEEPKMFDVT